jgi:hypothetical protein
MASERVVARARNWYTSADVPFKIYLDDQLVVFITTTVESAKALFDFLKNNGFDLEDRLLPADENNWYGWELEDIIENMEAEENDGDSEAV